MRYFNYASVFVFSLIPTFAFCASEINTEVHVALCDGQLSNVLSRLSLNPTDSKDLDVFYFDTDQLDLYQNNLILRLRQQPKNKFELTVKIPKLEQSQVNPKYFNDPEFKCEEDIYGPNTSKSCSYNSFPNKVAVDLVMAGGSNITDALTTSQKDFINTYSSYLQAAQMSHPLGPSIVQTWKFKRSTFQNDLTLEYWSVSNDLQLVEISTRYPQSQALQIKAQLINELAGLGLTVCTEQSSKTQAVLKYFSKSK